MMQQLYELLQSYFNLRSAVLRKLADATLSDLEIQDALALSYEVLRRRRRDPLAWQPDEICGLAELLGLSNKRGMELKTITRQLDLFPNEHRTKLLKMSLVSPHKLALRASDWRNWKQVELERIAMSLEQLSRMA